MNCREFQQQLEEAVESQGPTANEVAAFTRHLQECTNATCTAQWRQTRLLDAAIGQWRDCVPTADLSDRVLNELCQTDMQQMGRRPAETGLPQQAPESDLRPPLQATYGLVREPSATVGPSTRKEAGGPSLWITLGTVAAGLLLMLSLLTVNQPGQPATGEMAADGGPEVETPVVAIVDDDANDVSPVPEDGVDRQSRRMFGGAYAAMPLSATEFVTDAVVLVVPADLSDPDEEPSRADVWADRIGKRWEPIGRELSSAFEALIDVVPKSSSAS